MAVEADRFTSLHNGGRQKTDRCKMKQEIRAGQKHIKTQFASLAAKLDGWRKEMQADQDESKTRDFKANPEDMESELEHRRSLRKMPQ
jgi:hypothetical protein